MLGQATDIIVQVTSDRAWTGAASQPMLAAGLRGGVGAAYGQAYTRRRRAAHDVRRCQSVEDKLNRLPLSYVDGTRRLLSRVTNDIDNLAQSLQQTVSQI
jgi:hypothetical protein